MNNPETKVINDIDALVDEQLRRGPYGEYGWNNDAREFMKCPHCPHDWHGLPCDECYGRCTSSTGVHSRVIDIITKILTESGIAVRCDDGYPQ